MAQFPEYLEESNCGMIPNVTGMKKKKNGKDSKAADFVNTPVVTYPFCTRLHASLLQGELEHSSYSLSLYNPLILVNVDWFSSSLTQLKLPKVLIMRTSK